MNVAVAAVWRVLDRIIQLVIFEYQHVRVRFPPEAFRPLLDPAVHAVPLRVHLHGLDGRHGEYGVPGFVGRAGCLSSAASSAHVALVRSSSSILLAGFLGRVFALLMEQPPPTQLLNTS